MSSPHSIPLPENCPVLEPARQVEDDARRLNKSLLRMRMAMKRCKACQRGGECPALEAVHSRIQAALIEIYQQWDLS